RSSSGRSTRTFPSSWRMVMSSGIARSRLPFGPLTATRPLATVTSTPVGTGIGERPTRLIYSSPHITEDLAAHAALTRLAVGHEALAGRQDGDAEAAQHPRQTVGLGVHAQARLRHAAEARDRRCPLGRVLHRDLEHPPGAALVVGHGEALDVALLLQDAGEGLLELRRRHAPGLVVG